MIHVENNLYASPISNFLLNFPFFNSTSLFKKFFYFYFIFLNFNLNFFPLYSMGTKFHLHVYIFFPLFVLLRYN